MVIKLFSRVFCHLVGVLLLSAAFGQQATWPLVDSNLILGSKKGLIAVEAEHFYKQTKTGVRAWYLNSPLHHPQVWPDFDTASYADASGSAYIEALPDLFHTDEDPISPVLVSLQQGYYSITLSGRSQGYAIDKILLINVGKKPYRNFEVAELNNYTIKDESPRRRQHH